MNKTGNQQMLKEINKSLLLNLIYQHGPISRIDLSRKTKLSPTTVSVLMEEAIREGIVHETGTFGSGVGRKMTLLDIHADNGYVLGIDLSRAPSRCVLLNLRGKVVTKEKLERFIGEESINSDLTEAIQTFISRQNVDPDLIKWLGVSVPGSLDEKREMIIRSSYLQLINFPIKKLLYEAFKIPVHLFNDLDAAGFAERFSGAAKGNRTIVYILIDYGVGAGFVINNQIFRGSTGQAGKIHDFYYYSTENLYKRLRKEYGDLFANVAPDEAIRKFIQLALDGREPFKKELNEIKQNIAKYCGNVLQLLNPEKMILNGWIAANEEFFQKLSDQIHKYEVSSGTPTKVAASYWKDYGPAIGAATLGLHQMFKTKRVL